LKTLSLLSCKNLDSGALKKFFKKLSGLKKLDLSFTNITGNELLALDPSKLEALNLANCGNLNREALQEFLSKATELKELNLTFANISKEEIQDFVSPLCEVRKLGS
ncbi:MAG: hypothetical protein PVI40_09280, partial [Chlamydiota bacterium]